MAEAADWLCASTATKPQLAYSCPGSHGRSLAVLISVLIKQGRYIHAACPVATVHGSNTSAEKHSHHCARPFGGAGRVGTHRPCLGRGGRAAELHCVRH